jgi:acetoin utilization deacetylase AcuC-like enzyme
MQRSLPNALAAYRNRIAILDVDYHHGNGTQDIFAGRDEISFASIHADLRIDCRSIGVCRRERNNVLNPPLARGTGWSAYVSASEGDRLIGEQAPELIICFGADTHEAGPDQPFSIENQRL